MIQKKKKKKKRYKDNIHPLSPLHTWRLKSQHHALITTFLFSTPRHELGLAGGVIHPLHSPPLGFIPLGFLLFGWWISSSLMMVPLPTPQLLYLA